MSSREAAGRARPAAGSRARAWLVTGPLGRGLAFAIDFAAALGRARRARRARRA